MTTPPHFPSSRSIYQKFREVDLLDKKKTVTALKPGEDRAILLRLGMILSSVMMYFVLGITILRSYADRYKPDSRIAFFIFYFLHPIKDWTDISVRSMFYSSEVLVEKLLQCPLNLKIAQMNSLWNYTQGRFDFISWDSSFFCIKLALHLNVNTVCGQRRVCVLYSTPRSQQTWTVPTTVGQTAGESPNTRVCRSTWASITRAASAAYLTMKRPRTPALKWVQCQRENTENYWTASNVDNGCQMFARL